MAAPAAQAAAERREPDAEAGHSSAHAGDYVIVDGHRLVKPYHFDFGCYVKQRWIGQSVIDIFTREFPARDRAYYLAALADGRLRVEGCPELTADTLLKDGQRMRHFVHRHEPPVTAGPIQVVGQSAAAVAVCKPAGMPVHVAGAYCKNTVLGVLQAERPDLGPLHPVHRRERDGDGLDKPVSGLLLFARSAAAASTLCAQIEGRCVEKVYVARVLGRFPDTSAGPLVADVPLDWDPSTNMASAVPGGAPSAAAGAAEGGMQEGAAREAAAAGQQQQQQQEGRQGKARPPAAPEGASRQERKAAKKRWKAERATAKADRITAAKAAQAAAAAAQGRVPPKPALTEFRLLGVAPDGRTSVVECRPRTGRTHQIRVHLQWLGHPIANDGQYGGTYGGPVASRAMARHLGVHWGGDGGGGGAAGGGDSCDAASDEACKRPRLEAAAGAAQHSAAAMQPQESAAAEQRAATRGGGGGDGAAAEACEQSAALRSEERYRLPPELCDALCTNCPFYVPRDYPADLRALWLHARSYSCQGEAGWSFAAEPPEWAAPGWVPAAAAEGPAGAATE